MSTLPDGSALAADRDRLARRYAREWRVLEHMLPAGHFLFGPEEIPLEIRVYTHHTADELGQLIGADEGEHIAIFDPARQAGYAVVTHPDGEVYAYAIDCSTTPHVAAVYQHGQLVRRPHGWA